MVPIHFNEAMTLDAQPFVIAPGCCDAENEGFFTNLRVDRDTLPKGWFAYDIRHGDDDEFCAIEEKVLVNFAGTFMTQKPVIMTETVLGKPYRPLGENLGDEFDYSFL